MLGHMLHTRQAWGNLKWSVGALFGLSYNCEDARTYVTHETSMGQFEMVDGCTFWITIYL